MSASIFGPLLDPRGQTEWVECLGGPRDGDTVELQVRGWSFALDGGVYHFDGGSIPWSYRWIPETPETLE